MLIMLVSILIKYLICTIISCKLLAQSAAPNGMVFSHLTHLPHLEFTNPKSFFLRSQESWRPSMSTLVTALMTERPLTIRLEPEIHDVSMISKYPINMYLQFKCSPSDEVFEEVPLLTSKVSNRSIHCLHARTFSLANVLNQNYTSFNLTLLRNHQINFENSTTHLLELRVRANFNVGNQVSASLFIYNLDALTKFTSANKTVMLAGVEFTKYFLTDEALKFFSTLAPANDSGEVQKIKIFEKKFSTVFSRAPTFIRYTLAVSIIMRANKNCTDRYEESSAGDIVFTNGDPDSAAAGIAARDHHSYIDVEKNYLMFSPKRIGTKRGFFMATYINIPISLCLRLSLNNPIWDFQLMLPIATNMRSSSFPVLPATRKKGCVVDRKSRWLILFEGMQNVVIFNRIICNDMDNEVAIVTFNGAECRNFISGTSKIWQDCSVGFKISHTGRVLKIEGPVNRSHSGNYKFMIKQVSFLLVVSVLSLPTFNTPIYTGALPHITYAILDTQITFNCSVFHDGMKHVNLKPVFRTFDLFKDSTWRELSLDQFAIKVLQISPNAINVKTTEKKARGSVVTLLLAMPHVMQHWRTWILTFTCRVTVPTEDAKIMGIPNYVAETSTDVEFRGRRIFSKYIHSGSASQSSAKWTLVCLALILQQLLLG